MITIQNISLLKGSEKFGSCNSCSKGSKETKIFKIKTETELGQGVSMYLCEDCANILLQSLEVALFND